MTDDFQSKLDQFKKEAQEFADMIKGDAQQPREDQTYPFQNGNDLLKNALKKPLEAPNFDVHLSKLQQAKESIFQQREKLLQQQIDIEKLLDNVDMVEKFIENPEKYEELESKPFELDNLDDEIENALNNLSDEEYEK